MRCGTYRLLPMNDDRFSMLANNADSQYVASSALGPVTSGRHVVVRLMLIALYGLHSYCPTEV